METASAFEQVITWALAIAAPLYALYSFNKGEITIRSPDGERTSYTREEKALGFRVSIAVLSIGAVLAWSVIFGLFGSSGLSGF